MLINLQFPFSWKTYSRLSTGVVWNLSCGRLTYRFAKPYRGGRGGAAPAKAWRQSSKSLQGLFMSWKPWGNFFAAVIHKSTLGLNKAWAQTEASVAIGNLLSLSISVHNETPRPCLLPTHHKFRDQTKWRSTCCFIRMHYYWGAMNTINLVFIDLQAYTIFHLKLQNDCGNH